MDLDRSTTVLQAFSSIEILAGESEYSDIYDLTKSAGNASIQLEVTGNGTARVEWVGTNDDTALVTAFITPNNASDIVTAFTKTSGPGSNGKHIYPFGLSLVKKIAIKVTETGGVNPVTVTALLVIQ